MTVNEINRIDYIYIYICICQCLFTIVFYNKSLRMSK